MSVQGINARGDGIIEFAKMQSDVKTSSRPSSLIVLSTNPDKLQRGDAMPQRASCPVPLASHSQPRHQPHSTAKQQGIVLEKR